MFKNLWAFGVELLVFFWAVVRVLIEGNWRLASSHGTACRFRKRPDIGELSAENIYKATSSEFNIKAEISPLSSDLRDVHRCLDPLEEVGPLICEQNGGDLLQLILALAQELLPRMLVDEDLA